jgi:hypothetical protein
MKYQGANMSYKEYLLELVQEYQVAIIGSNKRYILALQHHNENMAFLECNIRDNLTDLLNDVIEELHSLERSEK